LNLIECQIKKKSPVIVKILLNIKGPDGTITSVPAIAIVEINLMMGKFSLINVAGGCKD
jgi:hypothetical protein